MIRTSVAARLSALPLAILLGCAACSKKLVARSRPLPAPARLHLEHRRLFVDLSRPRILEGRAILAIRNVGGSPSRDVPIHLSRFAQLISVRSRGGAVAVHSAAPGRHRVSVHIPPQQQVRLEIAWRISLEDAGIRARLDQAISLEPGARRVELVAWHPRLTPILGIPEKPPFDLTVRVPEGEVVIAPGERALPILAAATQRVAAAGQRRTKTYRFTARVGPAELILLSGRFRTESVRSEGWRVILTAPKEKKISMASLRPVVKLVSGALRFFERTFGAPWRRRPSVQLVVAPIRGARAIPYAILLGEESGYLSDALATRTEAGSRRDMVLLHEIAHLWWGQSLTARAQEAALLHEGLAEFSALLALEHLQGRSVAQAERRRLLARAIRKKGAILGLPLLRRGAGAYAQARGAMVLQTLRARIGSDALAEILKELQARYSGSYFTFAMLRASIAQARDEQSALRFEALVRAEKPAIVRVDLARLENMPDGTFVQVKVENLSGEWAFVPVAVDYGGRRSRGIADLPPHSEKTVRVPVASPQTLIPKVLVDPEARALLVVRR